MDCQTREVVECLCRYMANMKNLTLRLTAGQKEDFWKERKEIFASVPSSMKTETEQLRMTWPSRYLMEGAVGKALQMSRFWDPSLAPQSRLLTWARGARPQAANEDL